MSPKLRVLVVDDERLSRETTRQQLREAGYEAEAVENAVAVALKDGLRTPDIASEGTRIVTTREMGDLIAREA